MFLRQSTASQEVLLGPFLDDTDGKTAETGLTIANTDIKVWKSGGTTESNKNSGGATHIASGRYYAVLDATDTDTVGPLEINVHVSGALPVRRQLYVLEEAVYDALFAASATGYQVPIWAAASSTVNLSGTTVKTLTDAVALPSSATISITGNITGNVTGSVGSVTGAVGSVTGNVGGSVSGSVGSVVGAVGSVTAGVTVTTNNDKAGYSLTNLTVQASTILATGTHNPQTGDSFARIGATGSALTSLAPSATALSTAVWTATMAGYLDVAVSSRLASASYTAPLDAAGVRSAVGLASDNLDTQLGDIPTVAEFIARTLVAANYGTAANQLTIIGYIDSEVGSIISSLSTIDGKLGTIIDIGGGATIGANLNHLNGQIDTAVTYLASLGLNGSGMSMIPWNAEWDAEVQSEVADGLAAFWTSPATLVDLIWDEATSGHATAGTTGKALTDTLADTNELKADWANGGRLDLILDAIAANVVLVFADTGTDGVVLSAATCNKIADHVRRRTQANVEASSDGDSLSLLSLYGVIQQIQESNAVGSTLTVYRTDGTTSLGTRTLATDPAADPVTGVS